MSEPTRTLTSAEIEKLVRGLPERFRSEVKDFFRRLPRSSTFQEHWDATHENYSEIAQALIREGYNRMCVPNRFSSRLPPTSVQSDAFDSPNPEHASAKYMVEYLLVSRRVSVARIAYAIGVSSHVVGAVRAGASLGADERRKLAALYDKEKEVPT